jgi:hypothetical protein
MAYLSPEAARRIIDALKAKQVRSTCPMCHNDGFSIADGLAVPRLVKNLEGTAVVGEHTVLPSVAIVCQTCGFIAQLALDRLGLSDLFSEGLQHG